MGNYYCKKCGICIDYYPRNIPIRNSCRIPDKKKTANYHLIDQYSTYPHRWKYYFIKYW